MLFTIIWLLGTLASLAFWGYMKGHADARFRDDPTMTENPPFIIGMFTSPFWPLQIAAGVVWAFCHVSIAAGSKDGVGLNTELNGLRKFASEYNQEFQRTIKFLTDNEIDPNAIDDNTKRALTARSIEWAMSEDVAMRREQEVNLPAVRKRPQKVSDDMFEILDKAGVVIESDEAESYHLRTKGPLDL